MNQALPTEDLRVLVVEDDIFQQQLLVNILNKVPGVICDVANNGLQAVVYLNQNPEPDIILCDLQMPKMDGVEFIRSLVRRNLSSHIVLTSSADADILASVKSMASSYGLAEMGILPKPVRREQVERLVEQRAKLLPKLQQQKVTGSELQFSAQQLLQAWEQEQLVPYFQPHIDAQSGKVIGAEALVRWQKEDQTLMPNLFLPRLFELGLGYEMSKYILEQALIQCAAWRRQFPDFYVSVNITPNDLSDFDFVDYVGGLLHAHQLPAKCLVLEVTENEVYPNMAKALDSFSRLRLLGVSLAIDDFGTGHSSMMQLCTNPFTELKIDQMFVRNMLTERKCLAVVKASLALAESLNIRTVAEGVEDLNLAKALTTLGCDCLQGYAYSQALSPERFQTWMLERAESD